MSQPRGIGFVERSQVNVDHATDAETRRSRIGYAFCADCARVF